MFQKIKTALTSHFLEETHREEIIANIENESKLDRTFLSLTILASIIATTGLMTNNNAVIIGSMIIAPLMWPIVDLGMSIVKGDVRDFFRALGVLIVGVGLGLIMSALISWLLPFKGMSTEILRRTTPNIVDLVIAFASGAVAALCLIWEKVSNAIAGVAIAASLLPPLCVVGISAVMLDFNMAYGALLLFIANLIAIMLMSVLVFWSFGFRPRHRAEDEFYMKMGIIISLIMFILFLMPMSYFIVETLKEEDLKNQSQYLLEQEITEKDMRAKVRAFSMEINRDYTKISADILFPEGTAPRYQLERILDDKFEELLKRNVSLELNIIPIFDIDQEG